MMRTKLIWLCLCCWLGVGAVANLDYLDQEKRLYTVPLDQVSGSQLIRQLQSESEQEAEQACRELFNCGEQVIPLLMDLKGNTKLFRGLACLGRRNSSDTVFIAPDGTTKPEESGPITIEITAIYLITAIYYKNFEFCSVPYLMDRREPASERMWCNSKERITRAWKAIDQWEGIRMVKGLSFMKQQQHYPLKNSNIAFWGGEL